jgi:hypothetical protein
VPVPERPRQRSGQWPVAACGCEHLIACAQQGSGYHRDQLGQGLKVASTLKKILEKMEKMPG